MLHSVNISTILGKVGFSPSPVIYYLEIVTLTEDENWTVKKTLCYYGDIQIICGLLVFMNAAFCILK